MKAIKINFLLICLFFCVNIYGQKYHQDPELDKYLGTWEWQSGNEKFTLIITKQKLLFDLVDEIIYFDYAVCWHSYTKNGQIIESTMDKLNAKATVFRNAFDISGLVGNLMHNEYISFAYDDKKINKVGVVHLTMLPGKTNEATWQLAAKIGGDAMLVIVSPEDPPTPPIVYTLPKKMTLKKIN